MSATRILASHFRRTLCSAVSAGFAFGALSIASPASAQTYGFATLPTGTLGYVTASAIAKVLKEKGSLNVLVQPTAGEIVILPMVDRGEAELGVANIMEFRDAVSGEGKLGKQPNLRLIGVAHTFRGTFWVRKNEPMKNVADLKGKKVPLGYSAMLTIDKLSRALLAAGGLTEREVTPVLVPNVVRGADDFASGAADTFTFAFGGPKVREVDATTGGIRALEIPAGGMPAAKKIFPDGYLVKVSPSPLFIGVDHAMDVYAWDNLLFTNSKVPDDAVYKMIDTLVKNSDDLAAVQPVLRGFSAQTLYVKYDLPYHPGALKYFKDHNITAKAIQ